MKHIGLFEGIGGFSLAARWMGWETVAWCEWNDFGQKVLKYHFPEAEGFGDITKTDFTKYANRIDILTGGFPCQPYSVAGKRNGKDDERHLWPEMLRAIREIKPRWVVGENVFGLVNWNGGLVFDEVQADLEAQGYEIQPYILPACAKNAPHRRDRVWFVAYKNTDSNGWGGNIGKEKSNIGELRNVSTGNNERVSTNNDEIRLVTNPDLCGNNTAERTEAGIWEYENKEQSGYRGTMQTDRLCNERYATNTRSGGRFQNDQQQQPGEFKYACTGWERFPTQSPVCGRNDGVSRKLDGITFSKWRVETIKAYGNAIVPQVALEIYKAIEQYDLFTLKANEL